MATIMIGFSTPKTWKPFAWLIQYAYRISYDHVYIALHSNELDRDVIFQASSTMVNFMGVGQFHKENNTLFEFPIDITDANLLSMMQFAFDTLGTPYGIKECIGLAAVRIAELFGKTIKNPWATGDSTYVCSKLVSYVLEQYDGLDLPKDPEDMTPLDVYNYMVKLKDQ